MGYFNDRSRQLARKRQAKRGAESIGGMLGLFGLLLLPFWWMLKLMFWFFFWPFKLFSKKK